MSGEKRMPPLWNPSQRGVIAGAIALLIAWLAIRLWLNPIHVSDPQPERPAHFDELADRIDPNAADAATLAALPGLGPARARDIVAYRDSFKHPDPNRKPFERPEDLLKVKGIGVNMLETMRPYLLFPTTQPSTRPSRNFGRARLLPRRGSSGGSPSRKMGDLRPSPRASGL